MQNLEASNVWLAPFTMPKTEQAHFRFGFFVACPLAPEPLIGAAFAIGLAAGLF